MKVLKQTCIIITLGIILYLWAGLVLQTLWGWFIVTTFHLPAITVPQAIGLLVIIHYTNHRIPKKEVLEEASDCDYCYRLYVGIARPLAFLIFGYVTHLLFF